MMTAGILALGAFLFGPGDDALPLRLADEARVAPAQQEQPPVPVPPVPGRSGAGSPFIDWDWLEVQPRIGVIFFSEDYESDATWSGGLLARAPMPWLSPSSDARGDYFGLFAEVALAGIDRDLDPAPDDSKGVLTLVALGIDFTLVRSSTWLLLVQAGPQYISFGGVDDLDDGFGAMAGLTGGLTLGEGFSLTVSPEVWFGSAGDRIYLASLGALIHF